MTAIDHDLALDMAADAIDFGLSEDETSRLSEHLDGCFDCKRYADMMASDDALLDSSITWEDAGPSGSPDSWDRFFDGDPQEPPEGAPRPRSDEEDDESDLDAAERDDARSDDRRETRDGDGDDEDDEEGEGLDDLTPLGESPTGTSTKRGREAADEDELDVTPVEADLAEIAGDDEPEPHYDPSEPEPDEPPPSGDDDEDEPTVNDGTTGLDDGTPPGPADLNKTHESEEQDEAYAIKQQVDAMTDDELANVEADGENEMPDCAADGVEAAAEENGAPSGDHVHQRAERAVQDEEGVSRTAYGSVAVYKTTKGIRRNRYGNSMPEASPVAAAAIRNAVLRSRTGRTGTERFQKRGRLDGKSLHRIAWRDERIFKKNTSPDPGKYFIRVAVDVSGSMAGQPVADAASVARALADATTGTPNVRLEVWGWSDPFTANHTRYYGGGSGKNHGVACSAGVVKVWGRGLPTSEVFRLAELPMGGTPDAPVLDWMWRDMLKEARSDETPVVIMCSDGWGDSQLPKVIEQGVKHGVRVMNVALGRYVHEDDQEARFGRGNYVPWMGSMDATARPLADMILRLTTGG